MALVSGGKSNLNPDAPLFIPAAFRVVEDFSPEWWELIKTSTWFHDYWLSQHQEEEIFGGYAVADYDDDEVDVAKLLPETFDLSIDEELFPNLEAQLEELVQSSEPESALAASAKKEMMPLSGMDTFLFPPVNLKNCESLSNNLYHYFVTVWKFYCWLILQDGYGLVVLEFETKGAFRHSMGLG